MPEATPAQRLTILLRERTSLIQSSNNNLHLPKLVSEHCRKLAKVQAEIDAIEKGQAN